MKKLIYCITLFLSVTAIAQDNAVLDKLKEYNFPAELLAKSIGGADTDGDHSFNLTTTADIDAEIIVEEAKYDPTQKKGEQWMLLSYNGKDPSKKEIKQFKKDHNMKEEEIKAKIDDSSWDIESDNKDYLVVNFRYDSSTLKWRYKYLADIKGKAFLNKTTKQLEKVEYVNVKPTKIKPFNVDKYNMVVNYIFIETEKIYLVEKEEINMNAKMFGQTVPVKLTSEYSNYNKI